MKRVVRTSLAIWFAVMLANLAHASPSDDSAKRARDAFAEGTTYFNLGQWDKAIDSWQAGYKLKPDPIFLYNIAQAYRLAEDHEKAIFFYKNYLRTAPKAGNRAEVQDKIDKLQELIEAKRHARELPPEGALAPATPSKPPPPPPPTSEAPTETSSVTTPPPSTSTSTASGATVEAVKAAPPPARPLRGDLTVQAGADLWAMGPGGVDAAGGFSLSGGYDVMSGDRLAIRVGAKIGYSYLSDTRSTDHFVSLLADPMLRVRLWRERLYLDVELGIGTLLVAGLSSGSTMLVARALPTGSFFAFELRPALALELRIVPRFSLLLSPALIYSPSPNKYFASSSLLRIDVSLGAAVRF